MAAAIANIMVAHNNVAVTKRHTSTHNPSAVPLLRLRTAQPVSALTISYPRSAVPAMNYV